MFIAIIFIAIGLAILLNTLGIISGGFWGFFWSILFIVVGVKMIIKKDNCPCCGWHAWESKKDECECGEECECHHEHNIEE